MSRNNDVVPSVSEFFRLRKGERLSRSQLAMIDFISNGPSPENILDVLSYSSRFAQDLDRCGSDSSDEDNNDDNQTYPSSTNNNYCSYSQNLIEEAIKAEEAEKNAKALMDEEEKLKKKAEKKKQKKMRQKEKRRLEKLEKENADKEKNKPNDLGLEKTKHSDKDENKNNIKAKNGLSKSPDPQHTAAPVQNSDGSEDDDADEEEKKSTMEPEELDMSSCFVSNAAAIAKRKLEQKPKPEKKPAQVTTRKHCGSQEKANAMPEKQIINKVATAKETVSANEYITRSVELAVIGNQYAASENMEMAVKYFTDAIKHNPKEYKLFGNRSFCYEKMKQYEKALTDAEIALSMDPKWIKGLYRKGKALVGLKRYYEARLAYSEVLKLDHTCKDAAEEMMRVQLMELMEMGFTKEQSSNALILHGTVEKALESLSGLTGLGLHPVVVPRESEFIPVHRHLSPANFPLSPLPQNQPRPIVPAAAPLHHYALELFPIWVGDLVPSITDAKLYELFQSVGFVHSVRLLQMSHCAFVNYTNKEDCEKAIQELNGYAIDGTTLVVRYPDRIHTRLGVSREASTGFAGKSGKQPDECYFWRTFGCIKNERCTYKHIPENKGIDRHKAKPQL